MLITVFVCVLALALAQLPHGDDLRQLVDSSFGLIDTNKDGELTMSEWNSIVEANDKNNDTCLTKSEYTQDYKEYGTLYNVSVPQDYIYKMFKHYDHDRDDCLTETEFDYEFYKADTKPHNGIVSRVEYDDYFVQLLQHIFNI